MSYSQTPVLDPTRIGAIRIVGLKQSQLDAAASNGELGIPEKTSKPKYGPRDMPSFITDSDLDGVSVNPISSLGGWY
eukprot:3878666-Alexandrium_andersonii.AAC.1